VASWSPVGGERRTPAVEEVQDDGQLGIAVAGGELLGAADQGAEDLGGARGGQRGGLHEHAAAVGGIGAAVRIAGLLQAVDDGGDPAGRQAQGIGQGCGGQRSEAADEVKGSMVGAVEAELVGAELVEPVDLGGDGAQCRLDGLDQETGRLLAAISGVVGVITLTAHFFIPPNLPPDTSTLAQLAAFGTRNHDALLVSAWLQTTGAVLIALFAVAIVHLAGAQARLSGWVTLLAATIVVVLSLLDSAFIIAAVSAPSSHPATATVSYDLIVGPTNDAVGRMFLLTLPLILPLGVVLLGATPPDPAAGVRPRGGRAWRRVPGLGARQPVQRGCVRASPGPDHRAGPVDRGRGGHHGRGTTADHRAGRSSRLKRIPDRLPGVAGAAQVPVGARTWATTWSTGSLVRRCRIAGRLPLSQREIPGGKVDSTIRS
jgi:hypothetical protein